MARRYRGPALGQPAAMSSLGLVGNALVRRAKRKAGSVVRTGIDQVLRSAARTSKKRALQSSSAHGVGNNHRQNNKKKRRIRKKKKAVNRVKKNLVSMIKKTVSTSANQGQFRKILFGNLNTAVSATTDAMYFAAYVKNDSTNPWDSQTTGFDFFTAKKYLDAVSILFNGKTKGVNWADATGNFDYTTLKVPFSYASVNLELTNMTQLVSDVFIHEMHSKENHSDYTLNAVDAAVKQRDWIGPPTFNVAGTLVYATIERAFRLSDVKVPGYTVKTHQYKGIVPGQKINWFHSKSNFTFEPKKNVSITGSLGLANNSKGSVSLLIEVRHQPIFTSSNVDTGKSIYMPAIPYDNKIYGWGVELHEVYKCDQPGTAPDAQEGNPMALWTDQDTRSEGIVGINGMRLQFPNSYQTVDRLA